ncbi:Nucleoporin [Ceratobasidium theobromae]|uniref:Nucleoporin n=1 Tax=Ceratobasidium theobromae TaxID=1582974 RepID=A0A5N5QEU0_9AGAM|nr:Nucleoporin [Ceratobasidium theobromae]
MLQSSVIPSTHADLITDTVYDYYGTRLATGGIDQKIKIWKLNELTGVWSMVDEWKAHDAPVAKIAWAHPEYGTLLASCSYDRTVKIWEDTRAVPDASGAPKFQLRATLTEARGTVRTIDFAPAAFGLKLVTIASDNFVRVYECHETYHLTAWSLAEEFDAVSVSVSPSAGESPNSGATPTQTHASLSDTPPMPGGISLQRSGAAPASNPPNKPVGVKEADGAWSVQWLKDKFSGEIIALSCGTQAVVKIVALQPNKPPQVLLTIPQYPANPPTTGASSLLGGPITPTSTSPSLLPALPASQTLSNPSHAITTLAWAPSCGRSYHLLATGSRDHKVRIFKLWHGERDAFGEDAFGESSNAGKTEQVWSFSRLGEFDDHKATVGRVEWNITGTILSSAGDDGKIRLWKATFNNVWRSMGTLGAVESEGDAMEQ